MHCLNACVVLRNAACQEELTHLHTACKCCLHHRSQTQLCRHIHPRMRSVACWALRCQPGRRLLGSTAPLLWSLRGLCSRIGMADKAGCCRRGQRCCWGKCCRHLVGFCHLQMLSQQDKASHDMPAWPDLPRVGKSKSADAAGVLTFFAACRGACS
jgi:hypothetical protein